MTVAILLGSITIIIVVASAVLSALEDPIYITFLFFAPITGVAAIESTKEPEPTIYDVKNGTAEYISTEYIKITENGDTINSYKTYEIVWKKDLSNDNN